MGDLIKKPFIFTLLTATLLTACGGSGDITPENPTTTITPTTIEAPAVGNVTKVSECGTLPGQWAFSDITTGNPVSLTTYATTAMQRAYRKSWGGTTTAYAIIKQLSGYIPVWNEGRKLHIGDSLSLTTHNMIRSIIITGNASNPTVLVGTDGGLDIIGLNYNGNSFSVVSQKSVDAITRIRSVATAKNQILSAGEQPTEMVYMVADDNVLIAKLSDLQLGFGCMFVAYQAKDHPVDPANAKDKRLFHPTKVVADSTLAAFLTSSRLPEEFVSADQFKLALQNEWLSFQSTAYLIDIARQTPVEPFVMQLGKFDRFFASDINITSTAIFLFGTSYQLSAPTVLESGIATYNTPIGTPIANLWSGIPAKLGDFRMGRMDTFVSTAFIRGLDSIARVDNFFAGPTQQKWSVWPTKQPFDYVRSATMRSTTDEINVGVKTIVTVPQFLPTGPTTAIWEHKDYQNGLGEPTTVPYTAITKVLNIGNRSVSYNDTAKNATVFQSTVSDDYASFPIVNAQDNDSVADANNARLFHSGGLIFDVRHGTLGPRVRVYKDTITGDNISTAIKGPAVMAFSLSKASNKTGIFDLYTLGAFSGMGVNGEFERVDDIKVFTNPALPNIYHLAILVHGWDGIANRYRVIVAQMDISAASMFNRVATIQGCSDIVDPNNNYSWNTSYGKLNDQAQFLGRLSVVPDPQAGDFVLRGFFQHYNPTYNVWLMNMHVSPQMAPDINSCNPTGEITPLPQADTASGLSAVRLQNTFINLHPNGFLRWIESATTTRILDIGFNIFKEAVDAPTGKVVSAGGHYLVQLNGTNGLHPAALLDLDGGFGENCSECQFTDIDSSGSIVFAANPERGIEMYDFQ